MKVFLDDVRATPIGGWVGCRWPSQVIDLLLAGGVEQLSLDHDLDDAAAAIAEGRKEITGYAVLEWLEEEVALRRFVPPASIVVHSSNPSGKAKMLSAIENIYKLYRANGGVAWPPSLYSPNEARPAQTSQAVRLAELEKENESLRATMGKIRSELTEYQISVYESATSTLYRILDLVGGQDAD